MQRAHRSLIAIGAFLIGAAACGGSDSSDSSETFPEGAFAVRANSDLGTGRDRLIVGVVLADGTRLGSPEEGVTLEVSPIDDPEATQRVQGLFTSIVEGGSGLYRGTFDFDRPGTWLVTVIPDRGDPLEPVPFPVLEAPSAPALGDAVPVLATPTLDDLPIDRLTTDDEPDERFYRLSLDEALASGKRTVLVFSTPAFCQTSACGPLLDNVKAVAPGFPDVNFIHVEVFTGFWEDGFVPDASHLAPSAGQEGFALPSEPWVFVIDETGIVLARFEGVMAGEELGPFLG